MTDTTQPCNGAGLLSTVDMTHAHGYMPLEQS
jgi:hypothetical protein